MLPGFYPEIGYGTRIGMDFMDIHRFVEALRRNRKVSRKCVCSLESDFFAHYFDRMVLAADSDWAERLARFGSITYFC